MKIRTSDVTPLGRPHARAMNDRRAACRGRARYLLALSLLVGSQSIKLLVPWLAAQAIDTVQQSGTDHIVKAGLITRRSSSSTSPRGRCTVRDVFLNAT